MFKRKTKISNEEESFDLDINDGESSIQEESENDDWLEAEGKLTIDVYQTPSDIIIKSAVAGVKPEDIDISIAGDMITIKGSREVDNSISSDDYFCQECYWGRFSRSVVLPTDVDPDKTNASLKNGILTVRLPKIDKEKVKKIRIKGGD